MASAHDLEEEMKLRVIAQAAYFREKIENGEDPRISREMLVPMSAVGVRILTTYFPDFLPE